MENGQNAPNGNLEEFLPFLLSNPADHISMLRSAHCNCNYILVLMLKTINQDCLLSYRCQSHVFFDT